MPYIERSVRVKGDKRLAYEIAKNMEAYPEFMPDVREVKIISRDSDGNTETSWDTMVAGRRFRWTEKDVFDDEACHISYRQTGGDLKKFEGEWRFTQIGDDCEITLTVDFDLGIPMLAALINPVLIKAVQMNSDKMLSAIKEKVEATGAGRK